MIDLYALAKALNVRPRHVVEIGVNEPDKCSLTDFINSGTAATLVEPLPWCVKHLINEFPFAKIIEAACAEHSGTIVLYDRGEGAWIESVPEGKAPDEHSGHSAVKRDKFDQQYKRNVRAIRFADEIDADDIDILCVDTEGAEWFVISQMVKARPRIVRVETHFSHSGYTNPYLKEITERMALLGYTKLVEDVSDTLWIR